MNKDPAQEFAERVANDLWRIGYLPSFKEIVGLIVSELRAGGWLKLAKPVKGQPREMSLEDFEATAEGAGGVVVGDCDSGEWALA